MNSYWRKDSILDKKAEDIRHSLEFSEFRVAVAIIIVSFEIFIDLSFRTNILSFPLYKIGFSDSKILP